MRQNLNGSPSFSERNFDRIFEIQIDFSFIIIVCWPWEIDGFPQLLILDIHFFLCCKLKWWVSFLDNCNSLENVIQIYILPWNWYSSGRFENAFFAFSDVRPLFFIFAVWNFLWDCLNCVLVEVCLW